jgi:hypothetical protein
LRGFIRQFVRIFLFFTGNSALSKNSCAAEFGKDPQKRKKEAVLPFKKEELPL